MPAKDTDFSQLTDTTSGPKEPERESVTDTPATTRGGISQASGLFVYLTELRPGSHRGCGESRRSLATSEQ